MNTPIMAPAGQQHRGFSLQELLVALAVVAILAGFAVPALAQLVQDSRRTVAVNNLLGALYLARSESQKRGQAVAVCGSEDGQHCSPHWLGWLVFVDANQNDRADRDEARLRLALPDKTLRWMGDRRVLAFRPFGRAADNGTLTVCDERGPAEARALIVSPSGRPRVSMRRSDGGPLECG